MKNKIGIILFFIVGLLACRKDKPMPCNDNPVDICNDDEFSNIIGEAGITWFSWTQYQYQSPFFNPNNGNEFVYNYRNNELGEYKLIKYNILTGIKTEIANNIKIITQPTWSTKGWIAFDNIYDDINTVYHIWRIKENGDSLTQITTNRKNVSPTWDSSGDNLYWHFSENLAIPYYFLKTGLYDSTPPDTILRDGDENGGFALYNDISSTNRLITITGINNTKHLAYTNINELPISFQSILNLEQDGFVGLRDLSWSNHSQFAYFTFRGGGERNGLYKIDVTNGEYVKLKHSCLNRYYTTISCSEDGTKLISEVITEELTKVDDVFTGEILKTSNIYLVDLITLEETLINLD